MPANREAVGYIRDKYAVHYVKMKNVRMGVHHFYIILQMKEIRGQHGWGNLYHVAYLKVVTTSASKATNFSSDARSSLSPGACTPLSVGPKDTMSSPGNFSVNKPHSSPACIAFTFGSAPNNFLYEATQASLIGETAAGAHPGYSLS